ncbi:MAG: ArsR family transcriptional regulator [Chloroflexota bacterium]|nr:ArsR family transcriptional regulator [Chloroflexota bacterium]
MIEVILGSKNAERVLIYIYTRGEGYAREIARFYETDLLPIQKQLDKLEAGGVLVSREVGKTRPYVFNPRYPFLNELKALLEKALSFFSQEEQNKFIMNRRRPRARGKTL